MTGFFRGTDIASDRLYSNIKSASNRYFRKAHRLTERMWASCGQFVDADAPVRARNDFYAVWWELYLAYALSCAGISLLPSKERPRRRGKGRPDLLATNPRIWIEAVMPHPGTGPDALSEPALGEVYTVPLEGIVLRLRTAIQEKVSKLRHYLEDGTISACDAAIIAVSGGRLPFRFNGYPIPDIVRAVCAVGSLAVELDLATKKRVETYVEFRDHVLKKSNAAVPTNLFLQKESAHVSAVLYGSSDCVNYPRRPGTEFTLVHNPNATVPLPDTWLPLGRQYWIVGHHLNPHPLQWLAQSEALRSADNTKIKRVGPLLKTDESLRQLRVVSRQ